MPPTIEEVRSILPPPTDDTDAVEVEEVLWGPISPADARAAGAPFASSSILLRPGIDPELRTRVLAEVPLDVIPSGDDTVASLVARLSSSSFLEDSHVQKSGCLKRRGVDVDKLLGFRPGCGRLGGAPHAAASV